MPLSDTNTPTPVSVRLADPDDASALAAAAGVTVPVTPEDASDPQDRVWVAECQGTHELVGIVGLRMTRAHAAEIHDLWVHPDRRGSGVGVRLMTACLGYCRDHGVIKTALQAEENQTAAINLFKKVGFLLARSRDLETGSRLEFYQDLYHEDTPGV